MANFNDEVYDVVAQIPKGQVLSYGQVATLAGRPRASRIVGCAMHRSPGGTLPCHRVVFKDGSLCPGFAFGGEGAQRKLLEKEGVTFTKDGKVNLKKHSAFI